MKLYVCFFLISINYFFIMTNNISKINTMIVFQCEFKLFLKESYLMKKWRSFCKKIKKQIQSFLFIYWYRGTHQDGYISPVLPFLFPNLEFKLSTILVWLIDKNYLRKFPTKDLKELSIYHMSVRLCFLILRTW